MERDIPSLYGPELFIPLICPAFVIMVVMNVFKGSSVNVVHCVSSLTVS